MNESASHECSGSISDFDISAFADRIRGALASDGVKLQRLATLSGIHRETIRAILACERPNPSIVTLVAISRALDQAQTEARVRREEAKARARQEYPLIVRRD